ncbi:hypothetical protein EMCRGX_G018354, partial [Ephydatia muelleri]
MNICTANLSTLLFIDTASSSLKLDNHKMQETALSIADNNNGSNYHSDQGHSSPSHLRAYVAIPKDQKQGELCAEDHTKIFQRTKQACSEWRRIGRELGFKENELEIIRQEGGRTSLEDYYAGMLSSWLEWATPNHYTPTVERLSTALRKASKEKLASDFEAYFGHMTSTAISKTDSSANALLCNDQGQDLHSSFNASEMKTHTIKSCFNKHKYWMTSYIIMCIMIVVSLPLYSYIYSCSNL